jgi:hypothetical protein
LFCPACGQSEFVDLDVSFGTVEESTALADGTVVATVACDAGTRLIARIVGGDAQSGDRIALSNEPEGQQGVFAFVPFSRENAY